MKTTLFIIKNVIKAIFGLRFKNGHTVREVLKGVEVQRKKEGLSNTEKPYYDPKQNKVYIKIGLLSFWEVDMDYQKPFRHITSTPEF